MRPRRPVPIPAPRPGEQRFIADAMLGRLARWLRTLDCDTAFDPHIADEDLVERAFRERRRILTRDRELLERWDLDGAYLVTADRPLDQLAEVVAAFRIPRPTAAFTRCRVCNASLQRVAMDRVAERLPEQVRARTPPIAECPQCDRVYWDGSHTRRMRAVLDGVFDGGA